MPWHLALICRPSSRASPGCCCTSPRPPGRGLGPTPRPEYGQVGAALAKNTFWLVVRIASPEVKLSNSPVGRVCKSR